MNQALTDLLITLRPPEQLLRFINKTAEGKAISEETKRWLAIWPAFDSWVDSVIELTDEEDMAQLAELIAIFDPKDVRVTELVKTGVDG